jgi:hypothetical protein
MTNLLEKVKKCLLHKSNSSHQLRLESHLKKAKKRAKW